MRRTLLAVSLLSMPLIRSRFVDAAPSIPNRVIDPIFFGMHIHHLLVPYPDGGRTAWPFLKFGTWRIWGTYTQWLQMQPLEDRWDFSRLDIYLNLAEKNKVDVLFTLGRTPTWASARPTEKCGPTPGCAAEPSSLEYWKNYVVTLVERYKGRISAYEIWNEPAFTSVDPIYRDDGTPIQYYTGSAESMVKLAEIAYTAIKERDPNAIVVSPSVTSEGNGLRRLDAYLKAGGGKWMDVVGFHFYESPPESAYRMALELRRLLDRHQLSSKPIWNTEMGYVYARQDLGVVASSRANRWSDVIEREKGASYLARAHILMAAAGISRLYWFNWDGETPHPTMGISARRGEGGTPMTDAYQKVQGWLTGSRVYECFSTRGTWVCRVQMPQGRLGLFVWTESSIKDFDARPYLVAKSLDRLLASASEPIFDPARIVVSEEPVLIVS